MSAVTTMPISGHEPNLALSTANPLLTASHPPSIRIRVDNPIEFPQSLRAHTSYRRATSPSSSHPDSPVSFVGTVHIDSRHFNPSFINTLRLRFHQLLSFALTSCVLITVVGWAALASIAARVPANLRPVEPVSFPWDDRERWKSEKVVKDVRYYARAAGYDIEDHEVETEDGYFLRMHRVINPRHQAQNKKPGYPILICHGLFQSSGAFITSEERSLAFWLSEQGYQVFLGNTRGIFGMGHKRYGQGDPRFWDWTVRELAMYDFPALVEWTCQYTRHGKIAYIGHSQGNGMAFIALSKGMVPHIADKLSVFIALAPAVYAGPLTTGFPFNSLQGLDWVWWKRLFGVLDFIPLMRYSYDWVPAKVFAVVGYIMFSYLFSWTDVNWLQRRKIKIFRFTPTPVSSASIFWWCGKGGFASRKCTLDTEVPQWFDERFPPLALYHGGRDSLVAIEPLLQRLKLSEPCVNVIRTERIEDSEHCDFYLAANAVEWCFSSIVDDIERTRADSDEGASHIGLVHPTATPTTVSSVDNVADIIDTPNPTAPQADLIDLSS